MGLTIHYKLHLKGGVEEALAKIRDLRGRAMDRSFVEVTEIKHFVGLHDCDFRNHRSNGETKDQDDDWVWALIQAQGHKSLRIAPDGRRLKENEESFDGCCHISPRPIEVIVFSTWPGEGCEEANFGLARYESTIYHNGQAYKTGQGNGWHWGSFCKTQYANEKGLLNFIRCHTLVVDMLDYAKELGILKKVHDEGYYFERRDLDELAREVGDWDAFIAGFSAQLKSAFGADRVESAIESYPNYENLVNIGTQQLKELGLQHLDGDKINALLNKARSETKAKP